MSSIPGIFRTMYKHTSRILTYKLLHFPSSLDFPLPIFLDYPPINPFPRQFLPYQAKVMIEIKGVQSERWHSACNARSSLRSERQREVVSMYQSFESPNLGLGYRCMNGNEWYLPSKLCSKSSPLILGGASVRRCDEDWVKKKYEKILAKCKLYTQPRSIHMPRFLWFSVQNEWTYLSRIVPNLGSD